MKTLYDNPWYPNLGVIKRPNPKKVNPYDSKALKRTKSWMLRKLNIK